MAYSDILDFNTVGSKYAPYKFTRKNMIRRIGVESISDLEVYETNIMYTLSNSDATQTYRIGFKNILDVNPEIASRAVDYTIDTESSCILSGWASYPIQWSDNNNQMASIYLRKDTKEIMLTTTGKWGGYVANIYLNAYIPA